MVCLLPLSAFAGGHAHHRDFIDGDIIVKLKGKDGSNSANAFIGKAVSMKGMRLRGSWRGLNMHHMHIRAGDDMQARLNEMNSDPAVEFAEPNYLMQAQSTGPETQPQSLADLQAQGGAGGGNNAFVNQSTYAPIQYLNSWAHETGGLSAPIVAVVDTGISAGHSVFTQSQVIWVNPGESGVDGSGHSKTSNGIDDDSNGYIDDVSGWNFVSGSNNPNDDNGHGTHVSGIVLGTTTDIFASPVATAKIKIMPLKFLNASGSGSTSDAVNAIYYATNNGARVISNSWGGGGFSNSLLQAISYAYSHNVVFAAAAGNSASNNDASPTYPANYNVPNVISVAATYDNDGLASFSNYGAQTVHLGSPGYGILSTYPGNTYVAESGTSMATPFVAGTAALMVRENPALTSYQIKTLLLAGLNSDASLTGITTTGGRLNVLNSILASQTTSGAGSQPVYDLSANERSPAAIEATQGAGCGRVSYEILKRSADDDSSGPPTSLAKDLNFFFLLVLLTSPIVLAVILRRKSGVNARRHERYQIDSQVRVRVGDRELVGSVSTISLGGVQLNTDAWLERGGMVSMTIASPDGSGEVHVQGKVVWSEEKKHYGVQFAEAHETALAAISRWTQSLLKA
jgi:subtilisin family serine protease